MLRRKTSLLGALVAVAAILAAWLPRAPLVHAQAPSGVCAAGQIDLAAYWFPPGPTTFQQLVCSTTIDLPAGNTVAEITPIPVPEGAPGTQAVQIRGGTDAAGRAQYFIYSYDNTNVYFLEDQVWNESCQGGGAAFYRPHTLDGQWGARYPRCIADGDSFTSNEHVTTYEKAPYFESGAVRECNTAFTSDTTVTKVVKRVDPASYRGASVGTGGDMIAVQTVGGAGSGETMFFTQGKGMTGFLAEEGGPGGEVFLHLVYADTPNPSKLLCEETLQGEKPVFIYPRNQDELTKYLSNTQVYCAPPQLYQPIDPGTKPNLSTCFEAGDQAPNAEYDALITRNPNECNNTQYPLIRSQAESGLANLSFPLFRSEGGGVSVEADLSKTAPNQTIADALKSGNRADYAPQFYLSSPETQCLSAVRYLQYAQRLCAEWESGRDPQTCQANVLVDLPEGARQRLFDLAPELSSETVCLNFSQEVEKNTRRAQIVSSIQPYTPKVFKLGFLVQHTWLFGGRYPLVGQFLSQHLAAWFSGSESQPNFGEAGGEKLAVVPIWYNSGLTPNEYDQTQSLPYSLDPTNLPSEPEISAGNFSGSLWRTYAALLPDYVQKSIATDRVIAVDQNYQFMKANLAGYNPNPVIVDCSNPDDCLCLKENDGDISCQNETYDELRNAFPEGFEPDNAFLEQVKAQVLARINAGIQKSEPYPTALKTTNGTQTEAGPLSNRSFTRCEIDPDNKKLGQIEETGSILSSALQALTDLVSDPSGASLKEAITAISSSVVAKIKPTNYDNLLEEEHSDRTYLILPDEAMNIDIEQAYITPMFLSPEMYASIMSGENPVYPFNLDEAGNPKPAEDQKPLSAFLRTVGLSRLVRSEQPEGYARVRTSYYGLSCENFTDLSTCTCGSSVVLTNDDPRWVEYDQEGADQSPTPSNGCVKNEYLETSIVDVQGAKPGTNPNANPQTPGQLAALNEFLRRQAFTPDYMQAFSAYPGLEQYYFGAGGAPPSRLPGLPDLTKLSQYFRTLMDNFQTLLDLAKPVRDCDLLYVSQEEAQRYGEHLRAAVAKPEIWNWLVDKYNGSNVFGTCGSLTCLEFMIQITASTPVGTGDQYINPLIAFLIARSETGSTPGLVTRNFGCNIAGFERYQSGTLDGFACTVKTATGAEVVNPILMASSGDPGAVSTEYYNACIDETGGRAPSLENTFEDGLACFISYAQSTYIGGKNDTQMFDGYSGTRVHNAYLNAQMELLDELATQVSRAAAETGTADAGVAAAQQQIRADAAEMVRRMSACPL